MFPGKTIKTFPDTTGGTAGGDTGKKKFNIALK